MKAVVTVHLKDKSVLQNIPVFGKLFHTEWLRLELISSELDPETEREKDPVSGIARYWDSQGDDFFRYQATFDVPASFGTVGAVRVDNDHGHEMFIRDIKVFRDGDEPNAVSFHCNSWVVNNKKDPTGDKRTFFPLKSYLPSQTPKGVERLRKSELEAIRGNGRGVRTKTDRIYDYDVYNDLGNPDGDPDTKRPVLGGKEHPYPRRCRTGRDFSTADPSSEVRAASSADIYVPRDEAFSETKEQAFNTKLTLSGLHGFIQRSRAQKHMKTSFPSLAAIDAIFEDGSRNLPAGEEDGSLMRLGFSVFKKELLHLLKAEFEGLKDEIDKLVKFETPEVHDSTQ